MVFKRGKKIHKIGTNMMMVASDQYNLQKLNRRLRFSGHGASLKNKFGIGTG